VFFRMGSQVLTSSLSWALKRPDRSAAISIYRVEMPYAIRKLPMRSVYEVYNKVTHRVYARHTTKEKAEKQVRLLHRMEARLPE